LKYVNSNNDQKFRDKVFQFAFEGGFVFSSANFSGTQATNPFPVGFLVWIWRNPRNLKRKSWKSRCWMTTQARLAATDRSRTPFAIFEQVD